MRQHFLPTTATDQLIGWAPIAIAIILMVGGLMIKERQQHHLFHMISQPLWITNFVFVMIFYVFVNKFLPPSPRSRALKSASFHGLISLAIAVLSEAGVTVGPFWLVFVLSYFLGIDDAE
jgi:hypothetical protein